MLERDKTTVATPASSVETGAGVTPTKSTCRVAGDEMIEVERREEGGKRERKKELAT